MSLHDDVHVFAGKVSAEIQAELADIKAGFSEAMINLHNRFVALEERIHGHVADAHASIAEHEAANTPTPEASASTTDIDGSLT